MPVPSQSGYRTNSWASPVPRWNPPRGMRWPPRLREAPVVRTTKTRSSRWTHLSLSSSLTWPTWPSWTSPVYWTTWGWDMRTHWSTPTLVCSVSLSTPTVAFPSTLRRWLTCTRARGGLRFLPICSTLLILHTPTWSGTVRTSPALSRE